MVNRSLRSLPLVAIPFPALTALALFALSFAGCAMQTDAPPTDSSPNHDGEIASTEEAITNGTVQSEEYSGVVALQVFSVTINNWSTFCSATLMTNNKAITAKHCMQADLGGRQIYAKMGSQRIAVLTQSLHPTLDVAVIKLSSPMMMWNWFNNAYLTNPGKITNNGYGRPIYLGTNASIPVLFCLGYGGASPSFPQPPLKGAYLPASYNTDTNVPMNQIHTAMNGQHQLQEPGDSGGPGLTAVTAFNSPLAFVQSGCFFGAPFNFCYGAGAQDWGGWAYQAMIAFG